MIFKTAFFDYLKTDFKMTYSWATAPRQPRLTTALAKTDLPVRGKNLFVTFPPKKWISGPSRCQNKKRMSLFQSEDPPLLLKIVSKFKSDTGKLVFCMAPKNRFLGAQPVCPELPNSIWTQP